MAHLEKTQGPDAGERWMNVEELKVSLRVQASSSGVLTSERRPTLPSLPRRTPMAHRAMMMSAVSAWRRSSYHRQPKLPRRVMTTRLRSWATTAATKRPSLRESRLEAGLSSACADHHLPRLRLSSQPVPVVVNSLRVFLAVSMLATDAETQDSKADALERVRFCPVRRADLER